MRVSYESLSDKIGVRFWGHFIGYFVEEIACLQELSSIPYGQGDNSAQRPVGVQWQVLRTIMGEKWSFPYKGDLNIRFLVCLFCYHVSSIVSFCYFVPRSLVPRAMNYCHSFGSRTDPRRSRIAWECWMGDPVVHSNHSFQKATWEWRTRKAYLEFAQILALFPLR
jgi:hypothetical protein